MSRLSPDRLRAVLDVLMHRHRDAGRQGRARVQPRTGAGELAMIVYCEGPPDATHERFVVAHYQQHLDGNTWCGYCSRGSSTAAGAATPTPCNASSARTGTHKPTRTCPYRAAG